MENEMIQNLAWCYDVRTGWSEIEDVVWSGHETDIEKALSRAGFTTRFLKLGADSYMLEFEVHRNDRGTGPQFYVAFISDDNCEHFYLSNLPSLLAWLKDAAAIYQAGMVSEIISPTFGDSLLDNLSSYMAGVVRATRSRGRR